MDQRELRDQDGLTWVCAQAYAGAGEKIAKKAASIIKNSEGKIPVVCTPKGGAQSVRLELSENWLEKISDEEILSKINSLKK